MNIQIREALNKDLEDMVRLLGILFAVEEDFQFDPPLHKRALQMILDSSSNPCLALVAEDPDAGKVVAMLTVQTVISTATGGYSGWVEDVVVLPDSQGRGVGSVLLDKAEAWAREKGIKRLQLLADKNNQPALDFYRGRRWTGSSMVHRKKMIPS